MTLFIGFFGSQEALHNGNEEAESLATARDGLFDRLVGYSQTALCDEERRTSTTKSLLPISSGIAMA